MVQSMVSVEQIKDGDPLKFKVRVREEKNETCHQVTMAHSVYMKLTKGKVTPDRCIQAAFSFLLDRESKESILSSFDITIISHYFPSFEKDLVKYLR